MYSMNKRHVLQNTLLATGVGVAGATGLLVAKKGSEEKPVKHGTVPVLVSRYAGEIANIPVAKTELKAAQKLAKNYDGENADVRIDKNTGQPYRVADPKNPKAVQVIRTVAARDRSGTYQFVMNQTMNKQGEIDASNTTYVGVDIVPTRQNPDLYNSAGIYDDSVEPDSNLQNPVSDTDTWGIEITHDSLIKTDAVDDLKNAHNTARGIITPKLLGDVDSLMGQAVSAAMSGDSLNKITAPASFIKK
jgi:hypothetical protein